MQPVFDMSITLGNVLQIVAMVFTVAVAYARIAERLSRLETKVDVLWAAYQSDRMSV